ncbi:hypothetical protein [Candidatus Sulfurimonas baltica]|uniref:LPP20 lipoprotein n=1 Tax=Candidatus Sulfurimonas baltica TaxID=2740404 RepID=A0A7S7LWV5_9BACT|nr:hypothetical protein [Candidatus Sulfurimonas baltica]QOY53004.1 hypothetical protein HUE88_04790 [Candidatus Sulfurimonas baltica]
MMNIFYFLIISSILFFSGCVKQKQITVTNSMQVKTIEKNSKPVWISNPNYKGYNGVVGYAEKQRNKKLQKKIALITAKARLSAQLNIHVESIVTLYSSSKDNTQEVHSSSHQTSSNHIQNVIVKDEYIDKDGALYLWLITK